MGLQTNSSPLRKKEREDLEKLIPLSTPFTIYLETTNFCNLKCKFCPTGQNDLLRSVGREKIHLSLDLLDKIILDLQEFENKIKIINLYKDGDPLMNPKFAEIYRRIKQVNVSEHIDFKTNGILLSPDLNSRLINERIESMGISVEGVSAQKYLENAGVKINYANFLSNIEDFYNRKTPDTTLYIKILDINLNEHEKEKFINDFGSICDYYYFENLITWNNSDEYDFSLGNTSDFFDGNPIVKKDICPFPFYSMAINANGTVSVCCADWSHQTIIGDVKCNSLHEIWNSGELYEFRKMHLMKERYMNKACRNCSNIHALPDNIDNFSDMIMKSLLKNELK